jgi:hypothetical protein
MARQEFRFLEGHDRKRMVLWRRRLAGAFFLISPHRKNAGETPAPRKICIPYRIKWFAFYGEGSTPAARKCARNAWCTRVSERPRRTTAPIVRVASLSAMRT